MANGTLGSDSVFDKVDDYISEKENSSAKESLYFQNKNKYPQQKRRQQK